MSPRNGAGLASFGDSIAFVLARQSTLSPINSAMARITVMHPEVSSGKF